MTAVTIEFNDIEILILNTSIFFFFFVFLSLTELFWVNKNTPHQVQDISVARN